MVTNAAATPWTARAAISTPPVGASAGEHGGEREADNAGHECLAAAAPVADRTGGQVERGERERVGQEHPLLADEAEVEVVLDRRQRDDDHGRVDERERRPEHGRGERQTPGAIVCRVARSRH